MSDDGKHDERVAADVAQRRARQDVQAGDGGTEHEATA